MNKAQAAATILQHQSFKPVIKEASAFAPVNIALCKYWGKRNVELNLPVTSSLSVALPDKGAQVTLRRHESDQDRITLNGEAIAADTAFARRLSDFLDLFRQREKFHFQLTISMNVPVAAGLASSACGFAAVILALKKFFGWEIPEKNLSILARLGSGSASRSLWNGFVEWHAGVQSDGMDCFAEPLRYDWPALRVGLLVLDSGQKPLSSREAMQRTVDTSILYGSWPKKVARDLVILRQALHNHSFDLFAGASESNALSMHATMLSSWPPICFYLPETIAAMQKIWKLREDGLKLYFTQDAGPNLKLLFQEDQVDDVKAEFPQIEVCELFQ